mmetsp:Transcript_7648/g.16597  ORF Transcript_7648/g.16597 Transcript_7648/m.16597 type:complete len:605 (-) Transcript_7648:264-2078(-)
MPTITPAAQESGWVRREFISQLSDDDASSSDDDEEGEEVDDDESPRNFHPILHPETSFPSLADALSDDASRGLDLVGLLRLIRERGGGAGDSNEDSDDDDDFIYSAIKIINYCRRRSAVGDAAEVIASGVTAEEGGSAWEDDAYLSPLVVNDDAYVFSVDDLLEMSSPSSMQEPKMEIKTTEVDILRAQVADLTDRLARSLDLIQSLSTKAPDTKPRAAPSLPRTSAADRSYFGSYSSYHIHESMLRDAPRTTAYRDALAAARGILSQDDRERGVVLDIGCGTGILSICASKFGGARRIMGVDAAGDILRVGRECVRANGISDTSLPLVQGVVEQIDWKREMAVRFGTGSMHGDTEPIGPGDVVAIVSEWMGYALLFESMLPSVLRVRDLCIKERKDGIPPPKMFPNKAKLYLEGMSDPDRTGFWNDVYGVNMKPFGDIVWKDMTENVTVDLVPQDKIKTDRVTVVHLDLETVAIEELDLKEKPFLLKPKFEEKGAKDDDVKVIDALVVSFDTTFDHGDGPPVVLDTTVTAKPTHWAQTCLWLHHSKTGEVGVALSRGEVMEGLFTMVRGSENEREMEIEVQWTVVGANGEKKNGGTIKTMLGT